MLNRDECFKVLGLDESSGPNAIKKAYRKLAFELHPDLNPGVPDASQNFQRLNEAYVLLMHEYANTSFASGARARTSGQKNDQKTGQKTSQAGSRESAPGASDEKVRAGAKKAYERAKADTASSSGWGAAAGFDRESTPTGEGRADAEFREAASAPNSGTSGKAGQAGAHGAYTTHPSSREEILRDLLTDPFARRVFEDIYSHVRYNTGKGAKGPEHAPPAPRKKSKKVKASPIRTSALLAMGRKFYGLAGGITGGIKGWLRKQIDDEQDMFLPVESLTPGARIRLQVRHGFSGDTRTVEFVLPPEFVPGKPIRLKGLGRHVGGLQGDLYLRVFRDEEEESED
jgi:molecular chaperone DnaJ